ncbi:amino acid adenylation domain-containing protein [Streptomyces sp. NPDC002403]
MIDRDAIRLPLSAGQQGVWFAHQMDSSGWAYNCAEYIAVDGPVDVALFDRAWKILRAEADVVRIGSVVQDDGLWQVLDPGHAAALPLIDFSGDDDPDDLAHRWMRNDVRRPVDLSTGPVTAFALIKLSGKRFFFYYRIHHVVIDGYGVHLLGQRLAEIYSELAAGRTSVARVFGPLKDLLDGEAEYRASEAFAADRAYWVEHFGDRPGPLRVPGRRGAGSSLPEERLRLRLTAPFPDDDLELLRKTAAVSGTTWQILLMAVVGAYVHRVTGRQEVTLGVPVAGRRSVAARRIPGMATNSVPVRLDVAPGTTLADLVPRLTKEVGNALKHERFRLEDLQRELAPEGGAGALMGPVVNFMPYGGPLRFGDAPATSHNLASGPVLDLFVTFRPGPGGEAMSVVLDGNPETQDLESLSAHQERLMAFIRTVAAAPDTPIAAIDVLGATERRGLLVERNATALQLDDETVPGLFRKRAAAASSHIALVHGSRTMTYGELDGRSDLLARELGARGIGAEDLVALALPRSPELITAMLAVLKAGAAFVPVDVSYPTERFVHIVGDSSPACVVTTKEETRLPDGVVRILLDGTDIPPGPARAAVGPPAPGPDDPAYVIYTSGSTGAPKGVVVPHRGLRNLVEGNVRRYGLGTGSRVLQLVSPSFDVAMADIWPTLLAGGRLVLAPEGRTLTGEELAALLSTQRITQAAIPPVFLSRTPAENLPELNVLITGGEPPAPETLRRWAPGRRIFNEYGVTEATVTTTVSPPLDPADTPSIGRPVANSQVYVLDDAVLPVLPGAAGELYIGGAGVARGYLRRPELTAERFLPCPYGPPGSRMYRTGDLVRWRADEQLDYLGRVDSQVKVRGFRIELGEIEAVLAGQESVRAVVAAVWEDRSGNKRLVAHVVPAPGIVLDTEEVRREAALSLPEHMVPMVVELDAVPVTPNGKVDRGALPEPDFSSAGTGRPPADDREEILCALFAQVLGSDRFGVDDSFFGHGGDSILALQLVAQAHRAGLGFEVGDVFRHPTVAQLAPHTSMVTRMEDRAEGAGSGSGPVARSGPPAHGGPPGAAGLTPADLPLVDLDQTGIDTLGAAHPGMSDVLPLTPLQEGLLFHSILAEDGVDAYAAQLRFDLAGPLDTAVLRAAGTSLLKRHAGLRAAFRHTDTEEPVQIICDGLRPSWAERDLSALPEDEREAEALRLAAEERGRPFDMTAPPLLRFLVLKLADGRHRVVLTAHHILWDGWSTSILVRELFALYGQGGDGAGLPPARQHRDYLAWLSTRDRTESRRAWAAALRGLAGPTYVADGVTGPAAEHQAHLTQELGAVLTGTLSASCVDHGVTLSTAVHGAWGLLLSRITGSDDVLFGTSVSGRPSQLPGVESIVGLLANTVPYRVRLRAGEPLMATLARLQEEQLSLVPHHYLGLADIQRQAEGPRGGTALGYSGGALFDTAITFVNGALEAGGPTGVDGLRLTALGVEDGTHYPLRLVALPGRMLTLRLGYRADVFSRTDARRLLARLVDTLETLAGRD